MTRHIAVLIGVGAVLITAAGVVIAGKWSPKQPRFTIATRGLYLAEPVDGWTVEWRPVAETEEVKRAHAEQLNYDDAAFAVYRRADTYISIYAAYWTPGKMSHRLIATHTPDVCWTGAGWECREAGQTTLGAEPVEHRVFQARDSIEHVAFVHYAGGKPVRYGTLQEPPWHGMVSDIWRRGLAQRDEQLFVRISSNRPLREFEAFAPVQVFWGRVQRHYLQSQRDSSAPRSDRATSGPAKRT